jgi:putative SOS response-associated peptidase YedK
VPFWSKDSNVAYSTINAKAETITTSALYRNAMKKRRCLVPADFFYEWQKIEANAKAKRPHAIALKDGSPFAFAGLWESWKDRETDRKLETYTIITAGPNELMESIHNRMPVILKPSDYERWLAPGDPVQPPVDLLRPYDADGMKAWKVSKDVGNVRNNRPELIAPIPPSR